MYRPSFVPFTILTEKAPFCCEKADGSLRPTMCSGRSYSTRNSYNLDTLHSSELFATLGTQRASVCCETCIAEHAHQNHQRKNRKTRKAPSILCGLFSNFSNKVVEVRMTSSGSESL